MSSPTTSDMQDASYGIMLKRAREQRHLSVESIAAELNLTSDIIRALEASDYARLPEPVYARGYIRAYANLMQLDGTSIVAEYNRITGNEEPRQRASVQLVPSTSRPRLVKGISIVLVLVLAGLVLTHWVQERTQPLPVDMEAPALPADGEVSVSPEATQDPPHTGTPPAPQIAEWRKLEQEVRLGGRTDPREQMVSTVGITDAADTSSVRMQQGPLLLEFSEQCWTEIRDVDGRLLIGKLAEAGEQLRVGGAEPLSLLLGNAHSVRLEYDGRAVDLAPYTRGNVARLVIGAEVAPPQPR